MGRKRLLLHACCAPCSLEPVRILRDEGFEPTICWTNPNIQPPAEHDKRLMTLVRWARQAKVELLVCGCDRGKWDWAVAPHAFDREARCRACYALRLAETCHVASSMGFGYVSTTLAVSPYQLFDTCADVLERLAHAEGVVPVVQDFRTRYPEATRLSRELGMYRQNYCGCRFSAAEAALERHERRDERKLAHAVERARAAHTRRDLTEPRGLRA